MSVEKFYRCFMQSSTISSVLTFGMTCLGGNAFKPDRKNRLTKQSEGTDSRWVGGEKARKYRHSLSSIDDKIPRTILSENTK